jgi:hypothetical protein
MDWKREGSQEVQPGTVAGEVKGLEILGLEKKLGGGGGI